MTLARSHPLPLSGNKQLLTIVAINRNDFEFHDSSLILFQTQEYSLTSWLIKDRFDETKSA